MSDEQLLFLLQNISDNIDGVRSAAIVSMEGLIVQAILEEGISDIKLAAMYRKYFSNVDGFHAVSKAIALEAQKYGAPKNRIKVVYSGLDSVNHNLKQKVFNQPFP